MPYELDWNDVSQALESLRSIAASLETALPLLEKIVIQGEAQLRWDGASWSTKIANPTKEVKVTEHNLTADDFLLIVSDDERIPTWGILLLQSANVAIFYNKQTNTAKLIKNRWNESGEPIKVFP